MRPVREAASVATGLGVRERELDLGDAEACSGDIDRHAHLATEPRRRREALLACLCGEDALSRQGLARRKASACADQLSRNPFRDPEAAASGLGKGGNRQVAVDLREWS